MSNDLSIVDQEPESPPQPPRVLADMREMILGTDSESIGAALVEYGKRREKFRDWLRKQLVEGVHFGTPPGCEPKVNEKGEIGIWTKGKDGERGGYKWYPKEQWTPKPSFYKAGADFVCELMNVRDEYTADMAAWEQLGKPANTFVFTCKLISRATGEVLGEGRGVRRVGQKGGDENNAIKMAKKSAKVDAVLNAYGLADLFTQDLEDMGSDKQEFNAPDAASGAPKAQPRGQRVTEANFKTLYQTYLKHNSATDSPEVRQQFREWQCPITGIPPEACNKLENWSQLKLAECLGRLV